VVTADNHFGGLAKRQRLPLSGSLLVRVKHKRGEPSDPRASAPSPQLAGLGLGLGGYGPI
jgi:hypothetical protein